MTELKSLEDRWRFLYVRHWIGHADVQVGGMIPWKSSEEVFACACWSRVRVGSACCGKYCSKEVEHNITVPVNSLGVAEHTIARACCAYICCV